MIFGLLDVIRAILLEKNRLDGWKGDVPAHPSTFQFDFFSVVLGHQFEVSLLMSACRAFIWSLGAFMDVSAVSASPGHFGILLEDLALFYILQQSPVSVLMALFHLADISELLGDFLEALFVCRGGELGIHLGGMGRAGKDRDQRLAVIFLGLAFHR